jgi:hypothetical protein
MELVSLERTASDNPDQHLEPVLPSIPSPALGSDMGCMDGFQDGENSVVAA